MRLVFIFSALLFIIRPVLSQDKQDDLALIASQHRSSDDQSKEKEGFLFSFYQNHLSRQILNDCIYDHSCSQFSKDVFNHFGLLKGLMLTADRLTRCNRASHAEVSPFKINKEDKVVDHWDHYAFDR